MDIVDYIIPLILALVSGVVGAVYLYRRMEYGETTASDAKALFLLIASAFLFAFVLALLLAEFVIR